MRKLPVFVFALLLAIAATGCDSEEDLTESEILVGSWTVVEVSDDEGDKTQVFEQGIDDFSATLRADGTYSLSVDYVDPQRPSTNLQGTYTVDEGGNDLILVAGPNQLSFDYDIESENRIHLSIPEPIVQGVFQTDPDTYAGTITFTVERV